MCAISVVYDYGRTVWPNPDIITTPVSDYPAEREAIRRFMELLDKAAEFDKAANQPHCEDPEKSKLLGEISERLRRIEAALGIHE